MSANRWLQWKCAMKSAGSGFTLSRTPLWRHWLEQQFERELNGSRLIPLIANRAEAGIGHSGIVRASEYSLEGCPVERIEPIAPELHVYRFPDMEVLSDT